MTPANSPSRRCHLGLAAYLSAVALSMMDGWARSAGADARATGELARRVLETILSFTTDRDGPEQTRAPARLRAAELPEGRLAVVPGGADRQAPPGPGPQAGPGVTYDQAKAREIVEQLSIRKEAAAKNRSADLINACGSRAPAGGEGSWRAR